MVELCSRSQVCLVSDHNEVHNVDYLPIVSLFHVKHDRWTRLYDLTAIIKTHVPDCKATFIIAYGQIDLLFLSLSNLVNFFDCNLGMAGDWALSLWEIFSHHYFDGSVLWICTCDAMNHSLVVHADTSTQISIECNCNDLSAMLYQSR